MLRRSNSSRSRARRYLRFSFAFFRVRLNAAKVTLVCLVLFSLIVSFVDYRNNKLTQQLKSIVIDATLPALDMGVEVSRTLIHDVQDFLQPNLRYEEQLRVKDEAIAIWKLEAQRLQSEITYLKQQLNFKKNNDDLFWLSTNLFLPGDYTSTYRAFIKLGSKDGMHSNATVVSQYGLVGKLANIANNSSEVLLLGHPMLAVPVYVERTGHQCVVKGSLSHTLEVDYAEFADLEDGDRLLTSGHGEVFPRGISVAIVQKKLGSMSLIPMHTLSQSHLIYVLVAGS